MWEYFWHIRLSSHSIHSSRVIGKQACNGFAVINKNWLQNLILGKAQGGTVASFRIVAFVTGLLSPSLFTLEDMGFQLNYLSIFFFLFKQAPRRTTIRDRPLRIFSPTFLNGFLGRWAKMWCKTPTQMRHTKPLAYDQASLVFALFLMLGSPTILKTPKKAKMYQADIFGTCSSFTSSD